MAGRCVGLRRAASASEPYHKWIAQELERGRNTMGFWQDLADGHGFAGGYQPTQRNNEEALARAGAATLYIEPGSPWRNGCCKSFHSTLRDEFRN